MDQNELLKELRIQRQFIRKHLDWIEQKIASLENNQSSGEKQLPHSEIKPEASTEPWLDNAPTEETKNEADQALDAYRPANSKDLQRAKIGCLALFLLCSALFLFLLFGLPYLL